MTATTAMNWTPEPEPALIPYEALQRLDISALLVLAPHPDDEVFGCGGLLATAVVQGIGVRVAVVSDGGQGGEARVRERESRAAARCLGCEAGLAFWGLPDRGVRPDAALVDRIVAATPVAAAGGSWLLAPSPFEVHPDHRAVALAAMAAAARVDATLVFYEIGQPLVPNRLLDITEQMALKLRAMACFGSQLDAQSYASQVCALNHYRSYTLGPRVTHAEAFYVVDREVQAAGAAAVLGAVQAESARRFATLTAWFETAPA